MSRIADKLRAEVRKDLREGEVKIELSEEQAMRLAGEKKFPSKAFTKIWTAAVALDGEELDGWQVDLEGVFKFGDGRVEIDYDLRRRCEADVSYS